MRLRHIKNSENIIKNSIYFIKNNNLSKTYDSIALFNTNKPISLEIGMGKGQFICNTAIANKDKLYIGLEKYATVCMKAISNYEQIFLNDIENRIKSGLSYTDLYNKLNNDFDNELNLRLCCANADNLLNIFKHQSIDTIYLNFSDPWPKNKDSHRRLTSEKYLQIYDKLLINTGKIEFRTDNLSLFNFSIEKIKKFGYDIEYITNDLNSVEPNRIMTEYEQKFTLKGNKINKLIAIKNKISGGVYD